MTHQCVALTLLTAACGSAPDTPAIVLPEVDTMGGVVVVRNGPTGLWRESEQWQLVEEFRVGSVWDSADEAVAAPRNNSVTLGPNGQIFVLEYRATRVLVFSADGDFVRSFGGSGEGPGEFRGPHALAWDGADRLWVADGLNGRYHVFDSTGTFQRSVPRPVRSVNRIQHPLVVERVGILIDETATARGLPMVIFVRVDTMGHVVYTMAVCRSLNFLGDSETSSGRVRSRFVSSAITTYRDCDGAWLPTAPSGLRQPVGFA